MSSSNPPAVTRRNIRCLLRRGEAQRITPRIYKEIRKVIRIAIRLVTKHTLSHLKPSRDKILSRHVKKGLKDLGIHITNQECDSYIPSLIIQKKKIAPLVKKAVETQRPGVRISVDAMKIIHYTIETYVISMTKMATLRAHARNRVTTTEKDIQIVAIHDLQARKSLIQSSQHNSIRAG